MGPIYVIRRSVTLFYNNIIALSGIICVQFMEIYIEKSGDLFPLYRVDLQNPDRIKYSCDLYLVNILR